VAAAIAVPAGAANLITGKSVKNSSLTGKDIKNKSLTKKDFKGSITGPRGPQGPAGPQGVPGSKGELGNTGPQGPGTDQPALPGLTYHVGESEEVGVNGANGSNIVQVSASCDPGEIAVGGWTSFEQAGDNEPNSFVVFATLVLDSPDAQSYFAIVFNPDGFDEDVATPHIACVPQTA